MPEIIEWLGSFTIGEKVSGKIPPGANTIHIKIEYSNGTVFENGLDTIRVDGILYYTEGTIKPDCYYEIISF